MDGLEKTLLIVFIIAAPILALMDPIALFIVIALCMGIAGSLFLYIFYVESLCIWFFKPAPYDYPRNAKQILEVSSYGSKICFIIFAGPTTAISAMIYLLAEIT